MQTIYTYAEAAVQLAKYQKHQKVGKQNNIVSPKAVNGFAVEVVPDIYKA